MEAESKHRGTGPSGEEFGELIRYTAAGFIGGATLGAVLDFFGLQVSPAGQWAVRTLSGEGESLFEGLYAIRRRILGRVTTLAEAYAWGKLLGMVAPWIIDWGSRLLGINVYGVGAFYIPYFYALSDQIGANVGGLCFYRKQTSSWKAALSHYLCDPVMLTSLAVIFLAPIGLLGARVGGFSPDTQLRTALETIAANLCWVPPLVGWIKEG